MALTAIASALAGMNAASRRVDVAASNIANADSTGTVPDGNGVSTAYQPLSVRQTDSGNGPVATVVPRTPAYQLQLDPDNPDADDRGMVAAPAVDLATEVTDTLQASITYKANVASMKVANRMMDSLLDLKS